MRNWIESERWAAGCRATALALAVGAVAFAVYAATAQRGISWQDSGEYQYKFLVGAYDWEVGAGIARLHPTYILLTRLLVACLPGVEVPYVYALSSGFGMALSLAALALTVYGVTRSMSAACLSSVLLGGAHMAWWLSTMAEVYTWSLAFLMLELACLVRALRARSFAWFAGALFFNGCHFGVHNFALLNLPVYAVLFLAYFWRAAWRWGLCAAVWGIGALPILIPIARYGMETGSLAAVIQSALFGEVFQQRIFAVDVREGPLWLSNMALSSCSFLNPCWLYAAVVPLAAWRGWRKAGRTQGGNERRSDLNAQRSGDGRAKEGGEAHAFQANGERASRERGRPRPLHRFSQTISRLGIGSAAALESCARSSNLRAETPALPTALRKGDATHSPLAAAHGLPAWGTLLALTGVHALFWVRYLVPDQATFLLPTLGLLAVWAGLGAARVLPGRRCWLAASLAVSVACSVLAPHVTCLAAERLLPPRSRVLPFRDEFSYWAYPWKHNENSAERFVAAVAGERYPESMVAWVDTTAVAPLMAAQAMGRLPSTWRWLTFWRNDPDEEIVRSLRSSPDGGYVLSPVQWYVPGVILEQAKSFEKRGPFYRIVW